MSTEFSALGEYHALLEEETKAAAEERVVIPQKDVAKPKNDVTARVDRIMEYLREAETGVSSALAKQRLDVPEPPSHTLQNYQSLQTLQGAPSKLLLDNLKSKLVGQQVELEENKKSLHALTKDHRRLKEVIKEQSIAHQKELKSKLSNQRKEYEAMVTKHANFIDRVLAEKEEIGKKCEHLVKQSQEIEKQFKDKAANVEESYTQQLKQQKVQWELAEKQKRDKWVTEKTKLIKDQTIRSLEPEIQRMLAEHQANIKRMEANFQNEILKEREVMMESHARQLDALRTTISHERAQAASEERDMARSRLAAQVEQAELDFAAQKRKLVAQFDAEKDALADDRREAEYRLKKQLDELKRVLQQMNDTKEEERRANEKRLDQAIKLNAEQEAARMETWKREIYGKIEAEFIDRENKLRHTLIKEKEAEVEQIVQRLHSETDVNSSEMVRQHVKLAERMQAEHAEEVQSLHDKLASATERLVRLQRDLQAKEETEREKIELQNELSAKQQSAERLQAEVARLKVGEEVLRDAIREEFQANLDAKELELKEIGQRLLAAEMHVMDASKIQAMAIADVEQEKNATLHMLEERVRTTIHLKDEAIDALKRRAEDAELKAEHLQSLLEQQRKDLLGL